MACHDIEIREDNENNDDLVPRNLSLIRWLIDRSSRVSAVDRRGEGKVQRLRRSGWVGCCGSESEEEGEEEGGHGGGGRNDDKLAKLFLLSSLPSF